MQKLQEKQFMRIQRIILRLIGFWPGNKSFGICQLIFTFGNFFLLTVCVIPETHFLITNINFVSQITEALCSSLTVYLTSFKFLVMMLRMGKIRQLIGTLRDNWLNNDNPNAHPAYQQAEKVSHKIGIIFIVIVFGTGWSYVLIPIAKSVYELKTTGNATWYFPHKTVFPFDAYSSPAYEITYGWLSYATFIAVFGVIGGDMLFLGLSLHICVQFKNLQNNLKNIIQEDNSNSTRETPINSSIFEQNNMLNGDEFERLVICIKKHEELLELTEKFKTIFSPLLLGQFLISSFIICVTGFQVALIVNGLTSIYKTPIYLNYLASMITQLFLYSWSGTQLIEESKNIGLAAYNSDWHSGSRKYKQTLQLLILRSQRPCQMSTAFFVASLETFTSILSTAVSYFTLLQTLMKKVEK